MQTSQVDRFRYVSHGKKISAVSRSKRPVTAIVSGGRISRVLFSRIGIAQRPAHAAATIHLGDGLLRSSSSQPGPSQQKLEAKYLCEIGPEEPLTRAAPIWPCSEWGLPCGDCHQPPGALLPHPFTLACKVTLHRRFALCGTFPQLLPQSASLGGRYPPLLFRGARTFLAQTTLTDCSHAAALAP